MKNAATELSDALAAIVESERAGVVRVEARHRFPSSGAVWSADGVIVAANHAVEWDEAIEVALADGTTLPATLLGRDPGTDVAVLTVAATGLSRASFGGLDGLKVGHLVLALSRPGRTVRAASGIVSALGSEPWRTPTGGRLDRYVQSDVELAPGFSGSLLADARGRVLGLNTSGLVPRTPLLVPTSSIERVVAAVLAHGHVRRGYLGVGAQPVRLAAALAKEAAQGSALLLASVEAGSPAEKAGLLQGDLLVSFDGHPTLDVSDLLALLDEERVGTEVTARLLRGGQLRESRVGVSARPE
jgi:S1-C subfamily serine protease